MEDTTSSHTITLAELNRTVQLLMARSDDAENRLRCNNMQLVDLPEGAEGDQPAMFAENMFKQVLNLQQVSQMY